RVTRLRRVVQPVAGLWLATLVADPEVVAVPHNGGVDRRPPTAVALVDPHRPLRTLVPARRPTVLAGVVAGPRRAAVVTGVVLSPRGAPRLIGSVVRSRITRARGAFGREVRGAPAGLAVLGAQHGRVG